MASFAQLYSSFDADPDRRGKQFERFVKWFLTTDPEWSTQVEKVWLWDDYPSRWGRDCGIDLVFRAGSRLRITAQLVEAESGAHLWADKYDGAFEDVFDLQDRITESVVGVVEPSVRRSKIERSRRKRPESLDAYDLFLQSLPHMQARMPHGGRIAIPLLEKALELDPDYAAAHAHLAWCHEWCFTRGGFDEADKRAALIHAQATIASDTDDAAALAVAGWVTIVLRGGHDMALNAIERALSLNPSCAMAHYYAHGPLLRGAYERLRQPAACGGLPRQSCAQAEFVRPR